MEETFKNINSCMINYITDINKVEIQESKEIFITGHDQLSLLYNYLDEILFQFNGELFITKDIEFKKFNYNYDNNQNDQELVIEAVIKGEQFTLEKHDQGTEIKAITYSNMQIIKKNHQYEIFVIVDI